MFSHEQQTINQIVDEVNGTKKYMVKSFIGQGAFGKVIKVCQKQTNEILAIKVLERRKLGSESAREKRSDKQKRLEREILHHKHLSGHPFIIDFKEVFTTEAFVCIVMECADGGSMQEYMDDCLQNQQTLTEAAARSWFQQLIIAIEFSHSQNIINRDIKLDNMLLVKVHPVKERHLIGIGQNKRRDNNNEKWILKMCDFGYSKNLQWNSDPKSAVGTIAYNSPELLFMKPGDSYDGQKRDIWSCGVILYYLLVGYLPFGKDKIQINELHQRIQTSNFSFPVERNLSYSARDLVWKMLNPDPKQRYSVQQVKEHPWFQEEIPTNFNQSYKNLLTLKQKQLQSDDDIRQLVQKVFDEIPKNEVAQQLEEDDEILSSSFEDEIDEMAMKLQSSFESQ